MISAKQGTHWIPTDKGLFKLLTMAEKPFKTAHVEKTDDASSVASTTRKDEEAAPEVNPDQDWTPEEEAALV